MYHDTEGLSNSGAAYVFEKQNGSWSEIQKIVANDRQIGDRFGYGTSIYEDYITIGADSEDPEGAYNAGSVYIFEKLSNGTWIEKIKIYPNDKESNDNSGKSVSITDKYLIFSANDKNNKAGAAYIFKK